jgi:hypothetical protein
MSRKKTFKQFLRENEAYEKFKKYWWRDRERDKIHTNGSFTILDKNELLKDLRELMLSTSPELWKYTLCRVHASFDWKQTEEGYDFWSAISREITEILYPYVPK